MSFAKRQLEEQEEKLRNKLEGYRKHLHKEGTYVMDCPYCLNALSKYDMEDMSEKGCPHCGYDMTHSDEDNKDSN